MTIPNRRSASNETTCFGRFWIALVTMISTLSPKYAAQASIMHLAVTAGAWALIHGNNTAFFDTAAAATIVLVCSLITFTACLMTNEQHIQELLQHHRN